MTIAVAHAIDLDVASLKLDVVSKQMRALDVQLVNSIVDGNVERTMDGASTLTITVNDPRRVLLRSGAFSFAIDTQLDTLWWRLVKTQKQDDELTLTFEDRAVALLRKHTSARKASRAKVTRAEFALSLVREVAPPIKFVCPELHNVQAVAVAVGKGSGKSDSRKLAKALPYQFQRGGTDGEVEDSWTCLQRLASEVNWRCFASGGAVYFVSDTALLAPPPVLTVDEDTPGVLGIDFDIDAGKPVHEAVLTARTDRWAAAPGDVVQLTDQLGPAGGLWLVWDMARSLYDATATITLRRASKALPEPAPDTTPSYVTGKQVPTDIAGVIRDAWSAAQGINDKRYPYVWGGGHGSCGVPSGGIAGGHGGGIGLTGYDCSGSVCAVLGAAGLGFRLGGPVQASGGLASSWGVSGEGQHMTVYANAVHTFIVFRTKDGSHHWGTGDWGKGWDGAGFNPNMHPTSGFVARHWPGT